MSMKRGIAQIGLAVLLVASTGSSGASEMYSAKFRSMKACLIGIQKATKQKLEIVRDKRSIVTGFLANGENFACEVKETGSEGVYVEGWYTAK